MTEYGHDIASLSAFAAERREALENDVGSIAFYLLRAWLALLARRRTAEFDCAKDCGGPNVDALDAAGGYIKACPADELATPKVRRSLPTLLSVDSAKEVVESPIADTAIGARDRAILELLYGSGLRVSELCGLDLDAVDLPDSSARSSARGPRARRSARSPLRRCASSVARRAATHGAPHARNAGPAGAVSYDPWSTDVPTVNAKTRARVRGVRRRACGFAPSPPCSTRARRTCLTGGRRPASPFREMLGHASLSTTQRYAHVSMEHLMRVYDTAHPLARGKR